MHEGTKFEKRLLEKGQETLGLHLSLDSTSVFQNIMSSWGLLPKFIALVSKFHVRFSIKLGLKSLKHGNTTSQNTGFNWSIVVYLVLFMHLGIYMSGKL